MTKRRVPGYSVGTKGHSVLKKRVYVQPIVKRFPVSLARDEYLTPAMPGIYYDDYYDLPAYSPNKVNALTNAILDDTYDLHARSRGRDNRLLSQMNEALPSSAYGPGSPRMGLRRGSSPLPSPLGVYPTHFPSPAAGSRPTYQPNSTQLPPILKKARDMLSDIRSTPTPSSGNLEPYTTSINLPPPRSLYPSNSYSVVPLRKYKSAYNNNNSFLTSYVKSTLSSPSSAFPMPSLPSPLSAPPLDDPYRLPVRRLSDVSLISDYKPIVPKNRIMGSKKIPYRPGRYLKSMRRRARRGQEPITYSDEEDSLPDYSAELPAADYEDTESLSLFPDDDNDDGYDISRPTPQYQPRRRRAPTPEVDLSVAPYVPRPLGYSSAYRMPSPDIDLDMDSHDSMSLDFDRRLSPEPRGLSPDVPDLAVVPYVPKSLEGDIGKDSHANDMMFSGIVAAAAARARATLKQITGFDSSSGIVSVEGDIRAGRASSSNFQIVSPFRFKGSRFFGLEKPAVSLSGGDSLLTRYVASMREFRAEVMQSLENMRPGRSLSAAAAMSPKTTLTPIGYVSADSRKSLVPSLTSYRYDRSLISPSTTSQEPPERYRRPAVGYSPYRPLSLIRSLTPARLPEDLSVSKYKPRFPVYEYVEELAPVSLTVDLPSRWRKKGMDDGDSSVLTVLDKIRIKVSTEIHSSPKSAVAARRVMRKQAPVKSASPPRSVRPRRRAAVKEALLVGGTAEMQPKRRPKSKYAAERLRELNRAREEPKEQLSLLRASAPPPPSTYLRSSRPTQPSREWRAIRDVDGFTKPKNVLSWQHRIEARISPDDLLYQPTSYVKMRGRVRDVQDKMDKHRQLLDRNNRADAGAGLASGGSFSERTVRPSPPPPPPEVEEDYGSPRVSALRRKLRKVICKNRSDPNYYRD